MNSELVCEKPTQAGRAIQKQKRPSSGYVTQKSISQSHSNFEKVRKNIQLSLIEEVNASLN